MEVLHSYIKISPARQTVSKKRTWPIPEGERGPSKKLRWPIKTVNASTIQRVNVVDPRREREPTAQVSQRRQEVTVDDPTLIPQSSSSSPKRPYRSRVVVPLRVAEKHTRQHS